jgi:hypothetical protein
MTHQKDRCPVWLQIATDIRFVLDSESKARHSQRLKNDRLALGFARTTRHHGGIEGTKMLGEAASEATWRLKSGRKRFWS